MEVTLKALTRSGIGKGFARRARAAGQVPAVLYGTTLESRSLTVPTREMQHALHTEAGANVLINLELEDGEKYLAMAREIHRHPIRGDLIHVDFVNVARDVAITAEVPIHLVGESAGVKEGGQIDQHLHELSVEALPGNVPTAIEIDITALGIGDSVRVADITPPNDVQFLTEADEVVVAIIETQIMEIEEEAPAEELEAPAEGEEAPDQAAPAETPAS